MAQTTRTTKSRVAAPKAIATEEVIASQLPPKQRRVSIWTIILGVLLVIAIGVAGYFYYELKYNTREAIQAREMNDLISTLGAMMVLPEGEEPTVATVTDKSKLAEQAFFQKAENGDKVVVYKNSGKAILYRPGTKKIVDVATLNTEVNTKQEPAQNNNQEAAVVESTQTATIALYNGGTKVGVTDAAEKQIIAGLPNTEVTIKEKAVKSDYVGTVVVDVSGKNGEKASALAILLGAQVGSLPVGEVTPQADIAVIIGNSEAPAPAPASEEKKKN